MYMCGQPAGSLGITPRHSILKDEDTRSRVLMFLFPLFSFLFLLCVVRQFLQFREKLGLLEGSAASGLVGAGGLVAARLFLAEVLADAVLLDQAKEIAGHDVER